MVRWVSDGVGALGVGWSVVKFRALGGRFPIGQLVGASFLR